jgi:hypothetical protein
VPTIHG